MTFDPCARDSIGKQTQQGRADAIQVFHRVRPLEQSVPHISQENRCATNFRVKLVLTSSQRMRENLLFSYCTLYDPLPGPNKRSVQTGGPNRLRNEHFSTSSCS